MNGGAISKRLRYETLRRDDYTCRYCGRAAPDVPITVDHVIPVALGGRTEPGNLVTACEECNNGKSATSPSAPLVADVETDAFRWGAAMRRAAEIRREDAAAEDRWLTGFDQTWLRWKLDDGSAIERPSDWADSVRNLKRAGLDDVSFISDAIDTAMRATHVPPSRIWRYFCGICWREVDLRQEIASSIIARGGEPEAVV